jgi:hypothetical protein
MPPTAQRLREPAAFVLLAFGAVSTFFFTVSFLFGPGETGSTFSARAVEGYTELLNPLLPLALVAAVYLAHLGTQMKAAKAITLIALITIGVAALFGLIAVFSTFGYDGATGWNKTVIFFTGVAELAIEAVAGMLILGWFQQHAPVRPAAPAPGYAPQGQWQQPQQQWQPQAPQGVPGQPPQQQWGTPQPPQVQQPPQQVPPQQQWGTPAPQPQAPQQGGYQGGTDSMMTQAIPTMGQQQPPQAPPQPPAEGGGPFPVGNWTSE